MTQATFTVRINVDNDSDLNPVHLCEEIQCYLNSNHHLYDDNLDEHVNAEVTGFRVTTDNIVPFIAQEEY